MRNNVALVTGGTKGIGAAIVGELVRREFRVATVAREINPDSQQYRDALCLWCDLGHPDQIARAVRDVRRQLGDIGLLVNNAGLYCESPLDDLGDDAITELVQVNVAGLIQITKACLPDLRARHGLVINIASCNVQAPPRSQAVYTASKYAVQGFSDSLRLEVNNAGVRVTTLYPGPVNTWAATSDEGLLRPDDIARTVTYIAELDPRIEIRDLRLAAIA